MKKKNLMPIVLILICILALLIDYSDYTLLEADLEQDMYETTSEIIGPQARDYQLRYTYGKGRLRFYSGQVFKDSQNIPLIYAYKKHWLLDRYERSDYVLRYSDNKIIHHGPTLKTIFFQYTALHTNDDLVLVIDQTINFKTVLMIAAYTITAYLSKLLKE